MVGTSARGVASRNGPHKKAGGGGGGGGAWTLRPAPLSF
jgi:hypothetical protein